ncbi:MAG: asparagine--tRNA ligase [Candidatus Muirbacterium halophilum]|nr:asparagine--tRNA ligase [Candidatus Muirbacterium halophilum]MCK9476636.1 asparagine--tRNA ligase [Candidatus Muirbacterium halophilum]
MERIWIEELDKHDGQKVKVAGWVFNKRSGGKIKFLLLRDGSGVCQAILSKFDVDEETFEKHKDISLEASIVIEGIVKKEEKAAGGFEILIENLEVIGKSENYPIGKKEHGVEFLLDKRHLWLRSTKQRAIMKIRHEIIKASRDFLNNLGFINVDSPIFTPSACEGTTTLFEVDYFDEKAYLSQSGQLYNEASVMAHGRVYCFGPVFRAEKSKTRRHLTEFWQIEPEIAFIDFDQNMQLIEEMTLYILKKVIENRENELNILERDVEFLKNIKGPFPRISYTEAIEILKEKGHEIEWGGDFGAPDETVLTEMFKTPIFVHRFPAKIKAFYMKNDPENEELALGVDMLAPEGYGEIVGGGIREENLEILKKKLKEHNLPLESFQWFLDLREYGTVPHGGFGMGIERTVSWICGINHVREAIPFPRTIYRLIP